MKISDLDAALQDRALCAAHEAGHVILHEALGVAYDFVTLGDDAGPARVESKCSGNAEQETMISVAGVIAERAIFKDRSDAETLLGGLMDRVDIVRALGPRARDKRLLDRLFGRAAAIVLANLPQVKRVAQALVREQRLTPQQVRSAYVEMPLSLVS